MIGNFIIFQSNKKDHFLAFRWRQIDFEINVDNDNDENDILYLTNNNKQL